MSKKYLKLIIVMLALVTTTMISTTSHPVQAVSKSYVLNHTTKFKKIRILKEHMSEKFTLEHQHTKVH